MTIERRRQNHAHRQPSPKVLEPRIGLAEELAEDARRSVEDAERAGDEAGPLQRAASARARTGLTKASAPRAAPRRSGSDGAAGRPFPGKRPPRGRRSAGPRAPGRMKLAMRPKNSPIGATSEQRSSTVSAGVAIAAGEQEHADEGADQAAVEGHAAFPDLEDVERMGDIVAADRRTARCRAGRR